jgi:outer membrane lipoprotein SlyB
MNKPYAPTKGYVLALILGALAGGVLVAVATKALPKMMSGMMQEMKKNGFNPGET